MLGQQGERFVQDPAPHLVILEAAERVPEGRVHEERAGRVYLARHLFEHRDGHRWYVRLLYHALYQPDGLMAERSDRGEQDGVGTGDRPRVDWDQLKSYPLPLPPLPEQRRIVAAIEEQFARLDAGVAALERARKGLKRYRASVLKAAVEGRLTEEWRKGKPDAESGSALLERILRERRAKWEEAQLARYAAKEQNPPKNWRTKYKEPAAPDTADLPELPEGWAWTSTEQLGVVIGGLTKNQKRASYPTKLPYLSVANVYANQLRIDQVGEIGVKEEELSRALLEDGDLLVVEGNGSPDQIGRVAVWNGSIAPCVHQNHLIKVRFSFKQLAEYTLYWLLSTVGREYIRRVASSTSGLYTLSITKVQALPVPLPPLAEQEEIVAEVERRLSVIEEVEAGVEADLKRAARLRQSILKRAFAGKLVPQDPSDEPASVLLERIRKERERAAARKPKRGKPAKQESSQTASNAPQNSLFPVKSDE